MFPEPQSLINVVFNVLWGVLLCGILAAMLMLKRRVKRKEQEWKAKFDTLEQQQHVAITRIETVEEQHQDVLASLADIFRHLQRPA